MPLAKAMDDCFVAYAMNGEALRPQHGFPLRLMVPGFEGIFHTKYLRRIKVVDRYYMNYNDYGHLDREPKVAALGLQIGPKSVITFPSGGTTAARPRLLRDQRPGVVRRRRHQEGGGVHRRRQALEQRRDQGDCAAHGAHAVRLSVELGRTGNRAPVALHGRTGSGATVASTGRQVLEQAAGSVIQRARAGQHHSALENRERWERDTMGLLRVLPFVLLTGVACAGAVAYVWCRTHAERRGNPRVGYLDRSDRRGAPAGARNRQGRCEGLSREGLRRMPRGDGYRRQGAHSEKPRPARMSSSGRGDEYCRFARRSRRRCGITSIARCPSMERER